MKKVDFIGYANNFNKMNIDVNLDGEIVVYQGDEKTAKNILLFDKSMTARLYQLLNRLYTTTN